MHAGRLSVKHGREACGRMGGAWLVFDVGVQSGCGVTRGPGEKHTALFACSSHLLAPMPERRPVPEAQCLLLPRGLDGPAV